MPVIARKGTILLPSEPNLVVPCSLNVGSRQTISLPLGGFTVRYMTLAGFVFGVYVASLGAADSPKATATREKLKQKVTVDYKDELFRNVIEDLPEQVKGLRIKPDVKGGVSQN